MLEFKIMLENHLKLNNRFQYLIYRYKIINIEIIKLKQLEKEQREIRNEIFETMTNYDELIVGDYKITRVTHERDGFVVKPTIYKTLKVETL